jgi:NAD(P)-dependent dehydrogenase (short-subunit alcohol dehydrogenase family)
VTFSKCLLNGPNNHLLKLTLYTADSATTKTSAIMSKVCLITGGNTGIGKAAVEALLKAKPNEYQVVMAVRNAEKAKTAVQDISAKVQGKIDIMSLDLASMASVKQFAEEFQSRYSSLDLLLLNAGVWMPDTFEKSKDGHEMTFQVNHLSGFYLVQLLLPLLRSSAPSRVVVTSSTLHASATKEFGPGNWEFISSKGYSGKNAYNNSKLCNALFAFELNKREAGNGVTANAIHPGFIPTSELFRFSSLIGTSLKYVVQPIGRVVGFVQTLEDGGQANMAASFSDKSGIYFDVTKPKESSSKSRDEAWQAQLWDYSVEQVYKFTSA